MSEKLLLCPFCGGKAHITVDYNEFKGVECSVCKTLLPRPWCQTEQEAIAAWNRRTPDIVRCGECQHSQQGTIYPMCLYCYNEKFNGNGFRVDADDFCSYGKRRL